MFFRQEKADNDKCRFFKVAKTFWVLQNSKEVTDTMNKLNKSRKTNYISTFHFPNLYTKFLHNKLPMVKNSFIDFCFPLGENICNTVSSYGAFCLKDIKDNHVCLNKMKKVMKYEK